MLWTASEASSRSRERFLRVLFYTNSVCLKQLIMLFDTRRVATEKSRLQLQCTCTTSLRICGTFSDATLWYVQCCNESLMICKSSTGELRVKSQACTHKYVTYLQLPYKAYMHVYIGLFQPYSDLFSIGIFPRSRHALIDRHRAV
jgi:hypothetical protein